MTSRRTTENLMELIRTFADEGRIVIEMELHRRGGMNILGWFAASCCPPISSLRVGEHLLTAIHFRTWAREKPEELRKRFPEAMSLLAEGTLT